MLSPGLKLVRRESLGSQSELRKGESMFEPENELERLLVSAAEDDAAHPAFARALIDAECFMALFNATPGAPIMAPGSSVISEGTRLVVNNVEREGRN